LTKSRRKEKRPNASVAMDKFGCPWTKFCIATKHLGASPLKFSQFLSSYRALPIRPEAIMKSVSAEIDMVEKTLRELVRRPRLIRSTYWSTHVEGLLARPGLRVQDKQRLAALLDLISAVAPTGDLSQDLRADALVAT
jgi:hypothetical protein